MCWGGTTECVFQCVVRFIRSTYPSNDGQYSGHRDAEGEGGDDDSIEEENNTFNNSFHEIEEEASPKVVHFEEGQAIRLSMFFKTSQFSAEHVCQIVLESPIKRWQVSYQQELFTTATLLCKDENTYKTLSMFCFGKANDCTKFTSSVIND